MRKIPLFSPGPVPAPDRLRPAAAHRVLCHQAPGFRPAFGASPYSATVDEGAEGIALELLRP